MRGHMGRDAWAARRDGGQIGRAATGESKLQLGVQVLKAVIDQANLNVRVRCLEAPGQLLRRLEGAWSIPKGEYAPDEDPLAVARLLAELHLDADTLCAALLHDTTLKGNGELKNDFGEVIHDIVHLVAMPIIGNEEREKTLDKYFYNIANSSVLIRYLILADRLENVRALKNAVHKNKILRYKEETQKYIIPIAEKTNENIVFKLSIALYELK